MSVLCLLWLRLVYQCRHHHPNSTMPTQNYQIVGYICFCFTWVNETNKQLLSQSNEQVQPELELQSPVQSISESESLVHSDTKGMSIISLSNKGNFGPDIFSEQKQLTINLGPHQPKGPSPKDQEGRNKNRGFDEKW